MFVRVIFTTLTFIRHRVTESQTLKGTQYTGGQNFFVPDFNKSQLNSRERGGASD